MAWSMKSFKTLNVKVKLIASIDSLLMKICYRYTFLAFMISMLLSIFHECVGDNMIDCPISNGQMKALVDAFCLINGTFTVPRHQHGEIGVDIIHPGVGPQKSTDELKYHYYYQWVPFALFFQGCTFYIPHLIWKTWESGMFREVVKGISVYDFVNDTEPEKKKKLNDKFKELDEYLVVRVKKHRFLAMRYYLCEALCYLLVFLNIMYTSYFIGEDFLRYGREVMSYTNDPPENRSDPMDIVFPKVTKCVFRHYGPSGTLQQLDMMCLVATNIINEKIYLFLWFWFVFLLTFSTVCIVYRLLVIILPPIRKFVLQQQARNAESKIVDKVFSRCSQTSWFILHQLGKNMDSLVFSEFLEYISKNSELGLSSQEVIEMHELNN